MEQKISGSFWGQRSSPAQGLVACTLIICSFVEPGVRTGKGEVVSLSFAVLGSGWESVRIMVGTSVVDMLKMPVLQNKELRVKLKMVSIKPYILSRNLFLPSSHFNFYILS